ncbi:MAG: helix-hairpin-helix domain-containing protein [Bacteroidetes bacterium]|nr:helix-hairpin-helix domain-containing protein [Bacteroidota bacterium]MBU1717560.1 helix-hairpin-helix domain-containing protein [Bacteroidota bacterium]
MRRILTEYFTFNKRERNAVLVLSALLIAVLLFPSFRRESPIRHTVQDSTFFADATAFFEQEQLISPKPKSYSGKSKITLNPILFCPDTMDTNDWMALGLPEKMATRAAKYITAVKHIYDKTQLSKIYGFEEEIYPQLEDYIVISPKSDNYKKWERKETVYDQKSSAPIDLNVSDTTQLMEIRGIGPSFARRICKYRDRLGGFHSSDQLLEIYGVDSALLKEVLMRIQINSDVVEKIHINFSTVEELAAHPYITWPEAKAIIAFLDKHGMFHSCYDLVKNGLIPAEKAEKLCPYISFN